MKRITFFILGVFLFIPGSNWASQNKILLIGNSITQGVGSSDGLGFRHKLYQLLKGEMYPFSFVGSGDSTLKGHFFPGAGISKFYTGPGGEGEQYYDVSVPLEAYWPNIVVVHLGSNDANDPEVAIAPYRLPNGQLNSETASGKLANLIAYLSKWNTGARGVFLKAIFVCKIIPIANYSNRVIAFNNEIDSLFNDVNRGAVSEIPSGILRIIDQHSGFDPQTMFSLDLLHPNDFGYQQMAFTFFDSLKILPMHLEVLNPVLSGFPNQPLAQPLTIRVKNGHGNGVSEIPVLLGWIQGDFIFLNTPEDTTDESGTVSFPIQLGVVDTSIVQIQSAGLFISDSRISLASRDYLVTQGWITNFMNGNFLPDVSLFWLEENRLAAQSNDYGFFIVDSISFGAPITLSLQKPKIQTDSNTTILSYDAALVARHVVGLGTLTQAQDVAADVNQDDNVDIEDAARIARFVVGYDSTYTSYTGVWRFNPPGLHCDSLKTDLINYNFTGILLGDVHGGWNNWMNGSCQKSQFRIHSIIHHLKSQTELITIPITLSGADILSCDFEMSFNTSSIRLVNIETTATTEKFHLNTHQRQEGTYKIGLFSPYPISGECELLSLHFQVLNDICSSQLNFTNIYINDAPGQFDGLTWADEKKNANPLTFELGQNYPNPFNSETIIPLSLDTSGKVRIVIYNILGERILTLGNRNYDPGRYWFKWDGKDILGRNVSSGQYIIEVLAGDRRRVRKMEIIR